MTGTVGTRRNLRAALVCVMGLGLCSLAPPARGDEAPSPTRWYGWQTLAIDAVSLGTSALAFALPSGVGFSSSGQSLVGVGLLGYAAGPPVVHGLHGHGGKAGVDVAIRVTAPFVLGLVGYGLELASTSPCTGDAWCLRGLGGFGVGFLAGYAGAIAFDAAVLAREPAAVPQEVLHVAWPRRKFWVSPTLVPARHGMEAGLAGTF